MPSPPAAARREARFTTGSTMRHVLVMAGAGSAGLIAVFLVDFANLFYISLLGDPSLTAAVGYAATIMFFYISICVGLTVAATALVSRALGAEDRRHARQLAASAATWMVVIVGAASLASLLLIDPFLALIGARGETAAVAAWFLRIVLPSMPLLGLGMALTGILRAVGDARRSMITTLSFGLTMAALDPILILGLDLGITGAAIATVTARVVMVAYSLAVLIGVHDLIPRPRLKSVLRDFVPLAAIGGPAILTSIANPVANGFVTAAIAPYGDQAVAGWTVVSRLVPVCFGGVFALSGAVGPVLGQNFCAGALDRVRRAMGDALTVSTVYVAAMCLLLFVLRGTIVSGFGATGEAAELILVFCEFLAITFSFNAALFVANAGFNNLGYPALSTVLNWGLVTVGTVPFVLVGGHLAGAEGVLAGYFLGALPFGIVAVWLCYRIIRNLGAVDATARGLPVEAR